MGFLDVDKLHSLDPAEFRAAYPYPSVNPRGLITDAGFARLTADMPALSQFEKRFGYQRRAGQAPHDRYSLEFVTGLETPDPWLEFIDELRGDGYREGLRRLFDCGPLQFRFHWHYTPNGCSISPHIDAKREYGSHLFYLNTAADWDPDWGGETLLFDDGGRFSHNSAPAFDDFNGVRAIETMDNRSAILARGDHCWHGVKPIQCPEDRMRRIFVAVINPKSLFWTVRDKVVGKQVEWF
jgi:hypothetical protein